MFIDLIVGYVDLRTAVGVSSPFGSDFFFGAPDIEVILSLMVTNCHVHAKSIPFIFKRSSSPTISANLFLPYNL